MFQFNFVTLSKNRSWDTWNLRRLDLSRLPKEVSGYAFGKCIDEGVRWNSTKEKAARLFNGKKPEFILF